MSTTPDKAAPTIVHTITITSQGKPDMSLADMAAENTKAIAIKEKLKEYGAVAASVTIGKQTFKA
jgi:hypothetical protein